MLAPETGSVMCMPFAGSVRAIGITSGTPTIVITTVPANTIASDAKFNQAL